MACAPTLRRANRKRVQSIKAVGAFRDAVEGCSVRGQAQNKLLCQSSRSTQFGLGLRPSRPLAVAFVEVAPPHPVVRRSTFAFSAFLDHFRPCQNSMVRAPW